MPCPPPSTLDDLANRVLMLQSARAQDQAEIQRLRDELGMAQRTVVSLQTQITLIKHDRRVSEIGAELAR